MEKISRLRLVVEPDSKQIDELTKAIKRLEAVVRSVNGSGALNIQVDLNLKTKKAVNNESNTEAA